MVNVHAVDTETRLERDISTDMTTSWGDPDHSRPFSVFEILLRSSTNTLRCVETEETVIELPHNVLRRQEIIKHPLLAERFHVCAEDRSRIRTEVPRLVHRNENIFQL